MRGHPLGSAAGPSAAEAGAFVGTMGTGLLAIPVLAGATAYAIGEGRKWPVGLSRKPKEAVAFYGVLALSVALGIALNFTTIDPIKEWDDLAHVSDSQAAAVDRIEEIQASEKIDCDFWRLDGYLFLDTVDYAGFIGRDPGGKNIYVAMGDSGQGLTHGVAGAMVNTALILGEQHSWQELYAPGRVPLRAAKNFMTENTTALKSIAPGEISPWMNLSAGTGRS